MASDQQVKGGPANHAAHTDLDAPTPPGGPLRQDRPDANVFATGSVDPAPPGPDPDIHPSGTPDGPSTIPDPQPESVQSENAGTSMDQPSDGSGSE
ncbi:hypothetical protein [Nocardioides mesophilus]|uniref:Uncharacterized protein n=1 Tax=Nocardioides mesophilus TaxID=433659 RepID=A0A7G9R9J1_9ACTN|nr:hypothetical protein [Nocardioides mesophilus]QNN52266.1 hypothetical protein H9L09_17535 [Nocardioides mesophilus]